MPALVILSGLPGSGKTVFARALAPRIDACPLESDRVRRELFARRRYTPAEHARVFATVRARSAAALDTGRNVIIDATNLRERDRHGFVELAARRGARLVMVRLTAPERVLRERLARPREGASEADVAVYESMRGRADPFARACLHVDSRYAIEPSVALAAALCGDSA